MSSGSPPCVTAQWTTAATRVTSMGQPLVLIDSQATCVPTGTPLIIAGSQVKVTAHMNIDYPVPLRRARPHGAHG